MMFLEIYSFLELQTELIANIISMITGYFNLDLVVFVLLAFLRSPNHKKVILNEFVTM